MEINLSLLQALFIAVRQIQAMNSLHAYFIKGVFGYYLQEYDEISKKIFTRIKLWNLYFYLLFM